MRLVYVTPTGPGAANSLRQDSGRGFVKCIVRVEFEWLTLITRRSEVRTIITLVLI
jgi:hypothetical protein